jgi:hypothetical protein
VPEGEASRKLIVNSTQPLLEYNGFLRWALNNVAHTKNPTCEVSSRWPAPRQPAGWTSCAVRRPAAAVADGTS